MKYIPIELWEIIKDFIFHRIKYSKHLKNDSNIKIYNKILINLPKPKIPAIGINIQYKSYKNKYIFVKLFYNIYFKNKFIKIIEFILLPNDYKKKYFKIDKQIRLIYHFQYLK